VKATSYIERHVDNLFNLQKKTGNHNVLDNKEKLSGQFE